MALGVDGGGMKINVQITIESDEGKGEVLQEVSLPTSGHLRRGEACAHLPAKWVKVRLIAVKRTPLPGSTSNLLSVLNISDDSPYGCC